MGGENGKALNSMYGGDPKEECKFCNGFGQIYIEAYSRQKMYIEIKLKHPVLADCPKCNGTGTPIEGGK